LHFPKEIRYVAIEGVIGAGKTTLAQMLSEKLNARLVLERFDGVDTIVAEFVELGVAGGRFVEDGTTARGIVSLTNRVVRLPPMKYQKRNTINKIEIIAPAILNLFT